ncbi:MAG TPA: hypothetical protein VHP63_02400 [candidate division Zixibacteria bacterium]|nr:hypothetical protein [candidate division Zixibacteria bacterium]
MSIVRVIIRKDGPPASVEMICGHNQPGAYVLREWNKELSAKLFEEFGDFRVVHDDRYPLMLPLELNDECLLQSITRVGIVPPEKKYYVGMIIRQGEKVLENGKIEEEGESTNTTVRVHLRAFLEVV